MDYNIIDFTGSDYQYDYSELLLRASADQVRNYCERTRQFFAPIAKTFTEVANGQWILRHFLAIKFAISASILSGGSHYSRDHNLMIAVPYFNYYALLSSCRAYLLTSPDIVWEGRKTIEMTHQKILNVTGDLIKRLDPQLATKVCLQLQLAREHRELYSYRFPGGGLDIVEGGMRPEEVADLARLICELAMLNSECFEAALEKHAPGEMTVPVLKDHDWVVAYDIAGIATKDRNDAAHFKKYVTSWKRVSTLQVMASDGLVEDFYGAWAYDGNEMPDQFDPDEWTDHLLVL
jgi:hypothetical protein